MDKHTPEQRSRNMSAVKQRDTGPEIIVRKLLHKLRFRFRLCRKGLPGTPDIVLPKYKTCIFVHGCFWHHHVGCKRATLPKSNKRFWQEKILRNQERDSVNIHDLEDQGWKVLVVWECETKDIAKLELKLSALQ